MSLSASELNAVAGWIGKARPHRGVYYRSVSYMYIDPKTVLDGLGTQSHGGRFASTGTRVVYLSASDSVASSEVTARKTRLGGNSQISTDKYPRIVFRVAFNLRMVLDLSRKPLSRGLAPIRDKCLDANDLAVSQEVGDLLQSHGIDGVVFPSAVGAGLNLVVFKRNCAADALKIENGAALIRQMQKVTVKAK